MPIDLVTLLKVAPFPKEQRQKLLANFDNFSENQKRQLTTTAWVALSQLYFGQLKAEQDKMLLEIREGKRKFNQKDFDDTQERLSQELTQKLKSTSVQTSVEEVRQELQKHIQQKKPA